MMTICIVAVVVFFALFTYLIVEKMVIKQNVSYATFNFTETCDEIVEMERHANSLATQLLLDGICDDMLLARTTHSLTPIKFTEIVKQLNLYTEINTNVESIYLYNSNLNQIVASYSDSYVFDKDDFYDRGIIEIIDDYKNYKDKKFIKRSLIIESKDTEKEVYTFILDNFRRDSLYSAVIVNINANLLYEIFSGRENLRNSYVSVLDDQNEIIWEWRGIHEIDEMAMFDLLSSMQKEEKNDLSYQIQKKDYFALSVEDENGWRYVKIDKWEDVFIIQQKLQKVFLMSVICIIFLAFIISGMGAGYIYRPYKLIEREYRKLTKTSHKDYQLKKEEFLYNYINSFTGYSETELEKQLQTYGFYDFQQQYTLVLLKIQRYEKILQEFDRDGVYYIKFGLRNIFEELVKKYFKTQGIIYNDGTILFIVEKNDQDMEECITEVFEQFCLKSKIFFDGSYLMMLTNDSVSIKNIPDLKEQMLAEREKLFFYTSGQVLVYEKLLSKHQKRLDYSKLNQKMLMEALYGGKEEAVESAYYDILNQLEDCMYVDYKNALTWLAFSVAHIVDEGDSNKACECSNETQRTVDKFLLKLSSCDTLEDANIVMKDYFNWILNIREAVSSKMLLYDKMNDVKLYIENNFRNPNLSQELVAHTFGISVPYLRNLYKQFAGITVAEYINQIRLESAIEEIVHTQRTIKDIALNNGFGTANYFYTYFKKKTGMPPQIYREKINEQL